MIDYWFGATQEELLAAGLLASRYTVGVRGATDPPVSHGRADAPAFRAVPAWLDLRLALPLDRSRRNRNWRRAMEASDALWTDAGLSLDARPPMDFPEDELIDSFYHGILVRELYTRGMSPYGTHNLATFRQLLEASALIALVRRGATVVGGALLRSEERPAGPTSLLSGRSIDDAHALSGTVFALASAYKSCRRALWGHLADMLSARGWSAFSLGRETAWLDARYAPIVIEKLRWADEVTACPPTADAWLAVHPERAANRRMILFERAADTFTLRAFGDEATAVTPSLGKAIAQVTR